MIFEIIASVLLLIIYVVVIVYIFISVSKLREVSALMRRQNAHISDVSNRTVGISKRLTDVSQNQIPQWQRSQSSRDASQDQMVQDKNKELQNLYTGMTTSLKSVDARTTTNTQALAAYDKFFKPSEGTLTASQLCLTDACLTGPELKILKDQIVTTYKSQAEPARPLVARETVDDKVISNIPVVTVTPVTRV